MSTARQQFELRSPIGAFRAILVAVCAVLASLPGARHEALLPLLPLGLFAWLMFRLRVTQSIRVLAALVETVAAACAITFTGGAQSPMLPYLLAPGLALGLLAGPRAAVQGAGVAALALLVSRVVGGGEEDPTDFSVAAVQWVLLGLAVGLVAAWARTLIVRQAEPQDRYAEARVLLEQLRTVTRKMPGGLDAGTAAASLLEQAAKVAPNTRSAVLVQPVADGALVPLAVRGTRRVPWRAPLTEPGPLQTAWQSGQPVVDRRPPDKHGRRSGGALAVVPLKGSAASFGLLILEALDPEAFGEADLDRVAELAAEAAVQLETALLFDEVRSVATAEERERLAREIHDGVAQELAFIGYQLDDLRLQADKVDTDLGSRAGDVRKELTGLISNLRLSITDLKTSVSADRGLGSALSAYIRAIGSGRQLTIHVSLQESPFRLPSDREVALFQLAQIVAQDVRQDSSAENLWVNLHVDPPSARLVVEHDGVSVHDLSEAETGLCRLGGALDVTLRRGGGMRVEATFEGVGE